MTKFEFIIGVGIPVFFAIMLTTIGKADDHAGNKLTQPCLHCRRDVHPHGSSLRIGMLYRDTPHQALPQPEDMRTANKTSEAMRRPGFEKC